MKKIILLILCLLVSYVGEIDCGKKKKCKQDDLDCVLKEVNLIDRMQQEKQKLLLKQQEQKKRAIAQKFKEFCDFRKTLSNTLFLSDADFDGKKDLVVVYQEWYKALQEVYAYDGKVLKAAIDWFTIEKEWYQVLCWLQYSDPKKPSYVELHKEQGPDGVTYFCIVNPDVGDILESDTALPELHYVNLFLACHTVNDVLLHYDVAVSLQKTCKQLLNEVKEGSREADILSSICLFAEYGVARTKKARYAQELQKLIDRVNEYKNDVSKFFVDEVGIFLKWKSFTNATISWTVDPTENIKKIEKILADFNDVREQKLQIFLKNVAEDLEKIRQVGSKFSMCNEVPRVSTPLVENSTTTTTCVVAEDVVNQSDNLLVESDKAPISNQVVAVPQVDSSLVKGDWDAIKATYLKATIIDLWTCPENRHNQRALKYGHMDANVSEDDLRYQQWLHCFSYLVDRYINALAYKKMSYNGKVVSYYMLGERRDKKTGTSVKCIFSFSRYSGTHTWFHRGCEILQCSMQKVAEKWAQKDFFVPKYITPSVAMAYSSVGIPETACVRETPCFVIIYDPNHEEDIYLYKMEA